MDGVRSAQQSEETPAVLLHNEFGGPTCSNLYLYRITWDGAKASLSKVMRPPVIAVKGTTAFKFAGKDAMNFSNYSTTCIDPVASDLVWTYQGYVNSSVDRQWCSAWAAFKLPETTTGK